MNQLPIEAIKESFQSAFSLGPVVIEAPTGSGKSTRLPLWCAQQGRVLVVEPRRMACRSLARHLAYLEGQSVGQEIGYAVRYDSRYSLESRIVFVTPGVALRWYASDGLQGFDCFMLDEFHERRWDTDLLAALLRGRFSQLVVTSATLQGRKLAEYFQAEHLQASGRTYPVQVEYLEQNSLPSTTDLGKRVVAAVQKVRHRGLEGDILVFLPGRGEINQARTLLEQIDCRAEVIPLHATVEQSLQDGVLRTASQGRIILSTNVAESSLTLPGVRVVIDSGLERRTHHRNGRTVLGLHSVSRAAAEQRRGRAGRLAPGICMRLWGASAKLEPYTPPEILREDLTDLFLAAAVCGCDAERLVFADSLPDHARDKAKVRLSQMQALDAQGRLTHHGRSFFQLPLDPLFAHLIMSMPDQGAREMMVDLAACLSVQGRLLRAPKTEQDMEELKSWAPEPCDAMTLIRLIRSAGRRSKARALTDAFCIAEQTRELLKLPPLSEASLLDRNAFLQAVIRNAPELVYVRRRKRRRAMGNGQSEVEIGVDSRMPERSEAAVVFDEHSIPGKGTNKTLSFATCLAPVKLSLLKRLALGEMECSEPYLRNGKISVQASRLYAGREIASDEIFPSGPDLCRALAALILNNRYWKGLGPQIKEDIAAWNRYVRLGYISGTEVQPLPWLSERLQTLGLEAQDDLFLLDEGDLRFEGVPDWERERFDQAWPGHIDLHDLKIRVEYEPDRKTIELTRLSGGRKTPPTRLELPSWGRNWTIRYREGNRVTTIT